MTLFLLSWSGTIFIVLGVWLLGSPVPSRRPAGFAVLNGGNFLYAVKSFVEQDWALLALTIVLLVLNTRAMHRLERGDPSP